MSGQIVFIIHYCQHWYLHEGTKNHHQSHFYNHLDQKDLEHLLHCIDYTLNKRGVEQTQQRG